MFSRFKKKQAAAQTQTPSPQSSAQSLPSRTSSESSPSLYDQYLQLAKDPQFSQELASLVTLLSVQSSREYIQSQVLFNIEKLQDDDTRFHEVQAFIRGNSLLITGENFTHTMDLLEAHVQIEAQDLQLSLASSNKVAYHLKFETLDLLQEWTSAIHFANYDYTKLSENYTAILLSSKATQLSDVHVIMSQLKYEKEEWVDIKFNKSGKWVRCLSVIKPGNSKSKGSLKLYSSEKKSKKNLICEITDVEYCHALYPSSVKLIDQSALIKISGQCDLYNLGPMDQDTNNNTPPTSPVKKQHKRNTSVSSVASSLSTRSVKPVASQNTSLFVMPLPHGGVKPYETMIRLLIPLFDAFKLYGRPTGLIPDKRDPRSLVFGLPTLPRTQCLQIGHAQHLVANNWDAIVGGQISCSTVFTDFLVERYAGASEYPGYGDLLTEMNQPSATEHPFSRRDSISQKSAAALSTPQSASTDAFETPTDSPKYAMSISDLPSGLSAEEIEKLKGSPAQGSPAQTTTRNGRSLSTSSLSQARIPSSHNLTKLVEH